MPNLSPSFMVRVLSKSDTYTETHAHTHATQEPGEQQVDAALDVRAPEEMTVTPEIRHIPEPRQLNGC